MFQSPFYPLKPYLISFGGGIFSFKALLLFSIKLLLPRQLGYFKGEMEAIVYILTDLP